MCGTLFNNPEQSQYTIALKAAHGTLPPEPVVDTSGELNIQQFDDMWIVEGPWLQRLVATVNFSDYESRMYFDRVLREAGVFQRMEEMGVKDGDTVSMYDLMFEYKD